MGHRFIVGNGFPVLLVGLSVAGCGAGSGHGTAGTDAGSETVDRSEGGTDAPADVPTGTGGLGGHDPLSVDAGTGGMIGGGGTGGGGLAGNTGTGTGGTAGTGGIAGRAGSGGAGGAASCDPAQRPAQVLLVLDRSASMQNDSLDQTPTGPADPSKWDQVVPGLSEVIASAGPSISWGLKTFPEDGTECANSTVTSTIDVPIAAMNASTINAAIAAATPNGNGTPTAAAIGVATSYLLTLADGSPKYILLVTDGQPSCSGSVGSLSVAGSQAVTDAVAAVTAAALAGHHTFVVGVGTGNAAAVATLNLLATAGLEPRPDPNPLATKFYLTTTKNELIAALRTITGSVGGCMSTGGTTGTGGSGGGLGAGGTAGGGGTGPVSGAVLMFDDFEDGSPNGWISDDATTGSSWMVLAEGANHLYQQQNIISTLARTVGGDVSWTDQMVEAKVKFVSAPNTSSMVLLASRFKDTNDYYFVHLLADGSMKIRKRIAASTTDLASFASGVPVTVGVWHTIGLKFQGTTLSAYLDGTMVATATDAAPSLASGGIALGTQGATAAFDDVTVTVP